MRQPKLISRKQTGNFGLELAYTLPILIVILLVSFDCACFVYASDLCDRVCRQCARAAAQMTTPDDAVNAMNAVASTPRLDGLIVRHLYPELLTYRDQNTSSNLPTPAYGTTSSYLGNNGPANLKPETGTPQRDVERCPGPYLVVRTTVEMSLPFSVGPFSESVINGASHNKSSDVLRIQSTCSFPITNTFSPI
jgi:Flp pilus assembly protein TadG